MRAVRNGQTAFAIIVNHHQAVVIVIADVVSFQNGGNTFISSRCILGE
jgi:alanyl-tRNA synthetase